MSTSVISVSRKLHEGTVVPQGRSRAVLGTSDSFLRDVSALWRSVYFQELGWLEAYDDELLLDEYFERALFVVAYSPDGSPAGTVRVVLANGGRLPAERFCDLSCWTDRNRTAEFTRLMVLPEYRKKALPGYPFGVYRGLLRSAFICCMSKGIWNTVLNVRAAGHAHSILNSLKVYGMTETNLIIPDEFDPNSPPCTPVVLDLHRMRTAALASDVPLLRYSAGTAEGVRTPGSPDEHVTVLSPGGTSW